MNIVYDGSMDNVAFKDVLGRVIPELLEKDPDAIYLDADLMSCIGTLNYAAEHPNRAINCGIAEANMIGMACGLSAAGFKPIAHTFGPFASRRVFDQVFLSAGYAGNSITVLGTDPGVTAAFNGGTHMPFEDMALYRAIPGAIVLDITDAAMLDSSQTYEFTKIQGVDKTISFNLVFSGDRTNLDRFQVTSIVFETMDGEYSAEAGFKQGSVQNNDTTKSITITLNDFSKIESNPNLIGKQLYSKIVIEGEDDLDGILQLKITKAAKIEHLDEDKQVAHLEEKTCTLGLVSC